MLRLLRQLAVHGAVLGAVGLVAVGLSGGVAAAMNAAAGNAFIAGDPPDAHYSAAVCADFREYAPHAHTCEAAAASHHANEVVVYRLAAGVLGAALLAAAAFARRRRPEWFGGEALPVAFDETVATVAFGMAAAGLLALGVDQLVLGHDGAGMWLSGAIVAVAASALFAWRFTRRVLVPTPRVA